MEKWVYILISVIIILVLIVIFFVSYYFNKKTPVPKGCENLIKNDENCKGCTITDCEFNKSKEINKVEEKKE